MSLITIIRIMSFGNFSMSITSDLYTIGGIFYIPTKQVPTYITTSQKISKKNKY